MKQGEAVNGALAVGHPSVQATADVDERATLGPGTTVWHLAQIRENARLGSGCVVGRGAYVGPGVIIGNNVKLQNHALVYEPARQTGWVGRAGERLVPDGPGQWRCPRTGERYDERDGVLVRSD